jgi:hypothetical protein
MIFATAGSAKVHIRGVVGVFQECERVERVLNFMLTGGAGLFSKST